MPHYFTSLAGRPLTLSGSIFKFTVVGISGGRASGVYEATDPNEISILDAAVAGRRGISAISPEEYAAAMLKKNTIRSSRSSIGSQPRVVRPKITEVAVAEKAGVVQPAAKPLGTDPNENAFRGNADAVQNTPSIANLMRVRRVNPPKPFAQSETKVKAASARADRAKIRVVRASINTTT